MFVEFMGERLDRCVMRPYYEDQQGFNNIILLYRWYRNGMLADKGQMPDQANWFVGAALTIDIALDDAEREKQRRREKEQNAKARQQRARGSSTRRTPGFRGKSSRGRRR